MRVKDLIDRLSELEPDTVVYIYHGGPHGDASCDTSPVKGVLVRKVALNGGSVYDWVDLDLFPNQDYANKVRSVGPSLIAEIT